jgi:hypothetical protein
MTHPRSGQPLFARRPLGLIEPVISEMQTGNRDGWINE